MRLPTNKVMRLPTNKSGGNGIQSSQFSVAQRATGPVLGGIGGFGGLTLGFNCYKCVCSNGECVCEPTSC